MRTLRYISELAARQHGVIRTDQTRTTSQTRARLIAEGILHRKYRGVYAVGHPRLSPEGEALAAVFAAGPGAVLASLNAAVLWRSSRFRPTTIDVVSPTRRRQQPGFRLRTRSLEPEDHVILDGIPVMTLARTIVDLAECLRPEQLANVIHEAAFRRRLDLAALQAGAVLKKAIAMHEAGSAGTRSAFEDRFMTIVRAAKLPEPIINTHVEGIEVDFRWNNLCVEIDGPGHTRPHTRTEDERRDAVLEARGYTVIRFTDLDQLSPQELARRVARK